MTTFNVHIYREVRLLVRGVEAETYDEAIEKAKEKVFKQEHDEVDLDVDGDFTYALVDVQGDPEYDQSRSFSLLNDEIVEITC
jgi:hypothetical protein